MVVLLAESSPGVQGFAGLTFTDFEVSGCKFLRHTVAGFRETRLVAKTRCV